MFSIFSQDDQPETVRTSSPDTVSNTGIGKGLLGLVFVLPTLGVAGFGIIAFFGSLFSSDGINVQAWMRAVVMFVFLILPFGVVGGGMLWKSYKGFRRWQTYGPSHLHLETAPVPLGETLRARIRVPIADDEQPPSGFQVRAVSTQKVGDDVYTVWESETSVSGQPGPSETEVPLTLNLPAQSLPDHLQQMAEFHPLSSVQDLQEHVDWTLAVTASFEDKSDYEASFDLPVTEPDDLEERTADAAADGSITSPASVEQEAETADASDEDEVYWNVDGDSDDESGADEESAFTEPVTDRIAMEDGSGRKLSVSFSPASSWSLPLILSVPTFLLPLFFGGGGLLVALLNPRLTAGAFATAIPIATGCFMMAGFFFYWYWTRWLHTATVTVENGSVTLTETRLFAGGRTTTIPCEALDDVQVEQTHKSNSEPVYAVSLVQDPSRSTGPRSDQREIWVAGGLDNETEADWIADRIREAAEQQAAPA